MGEVIDFNSYKQARNFDNTLEEDYLKFLTHVNKLLGQPNSVEKCIRAIYFILRYLQGTINCLGMLPILRQPCPREHLEELKQMMIPWVDEIMNSVKNL